MLKIALSLLLLVGISAGLKCYECGAPKDPSGCPDVDKLNATYAVRCTDELDTCFKGMYCIILKRISKLHPIENTQFFNCRY